MNFILLRDIEAHFHHSELQSILETMLGDADLAKFAKHRPDGDTCQNDLVNAYTLVNRTIPKPKPILSEEARSARNALSCRDLVTFVDTIEEAVAEISP